MPKPVGDKLEVFINKSDNITLIMQNPQIIVDTGRLVPCMEITTITARYLAFILTSLADELDKIDPQAPRKLLT
jgi:hypothetical protein